MAAISADYLTEHLLLLVVFILRRITVASSRPQSGSEMTMVHDLGRWYAGIWGRDASHRSGIQTGVPTRVTCPRYRDKASRMNDTGFLLQNVAAGSEPERDGNIE